MGKEYTGTYCAPGGDLYAKDHLIQIRQEICQCWKTVKECRTAGAAEDDGQKPGMSQPAQEAEEGSLSTRVATQMQLALEVCVEQRLQHLVRPSSGRVRSTPDWRDPIHLPGGLRGSVGSSPSARNARCLPPVAPWGKNPERARWLK